MHQDLLFETSRFNLSEIKEHFINPCCFGEDAATWLRGKLLEEGMKVTEPEQEDWGWYIEAEHRGRWYFIGVGGNADESSESSKEQNRGEWRIMVEKHRSVWEKLTRQNTMSEADELLAVIREVLEGEADFEKVRYENSRT